MDIAAGLHFAGISLGVALSAVGVAIGQGIAGSGAVLATARQSMAYASLRQALILGLIVIESGGIFALITSLIFIGTPSASLPVALGVFGACAGIGLAAGIVGAVSGLVVKSAIQAMARQPFYASKIQTLMMIAQGLLEAPAILSFIMAFFIKAHLSADITLVYGWQLFSSGMMVALAAIGPAIGQAIFSSGACAAVGVMPSLYSRILQFSIVTQALIETPMILGVLLAFMIMMKSIVATPLITAITLLFAAMLAHGMGTIGAAVGSGKMAARAVSNMAKQPEEYGTLFRIALFSQAIMDTAVIFSFITALSLLLKAS